MKFATTILKLQKCVCLLLLATFRWRICSCQAMLSCWIFRPAVSILSFLEIENSNITQQFPLVYSTPISWLQRTHHTQRTYLFINARQNPTMTEKLESSPISGSESCSFQRSSWLFCGFQRHLGTFRGLVAWIRRLSVCYCAVFWVQVIFALLNLHLVSCFFAATIIEW